MDLAPEHVNASCPMSHQGKNGYRDEYTKAAREKIEELYAQDLGHLGYRF